jgi:hypothetical protein
MTIAGLTETQLVSKLRAMRRRAQKAEGALKAIDASISAWGTVFRDPRRAGSPYANMILADLRKAAGRNALASGDRS